MKFGRLRDAFERSDLREYMREYAGGVEQFEAAARGTFGKDAGDFITDTFGGDAGDERRK
jgi:hypothetical protein